MVKSSKPASRDTAKPTPQSGKKPAAGWGIEDVAVIPNRIDNVVRFNGDPVGRVRDTAEKGSAAPFYWECGFGDATSCGRAKTDKAGLAALKAAFAAMSTHKDG